MICDKDKNIRLKILVPDNKLLIKNVNVNKAHEH